MKKNIVILAMVVVAVIVISVGFAFAAVTATQASTKSNTVTVGSLTMTMEESSFSLSNAVPQSDTSGKANTPYTIKVTNTGTLGAKYNVCLVPTTNLTASTCTLTTAAQLYAKIKFNVDGGTPALLSTLTQGVCDSGQLQLNTTAYSLAGNTGTAPSKTTSIRMWYDSSAGNEVMGCQLSLKANIKAYQTNRTSQS